MVVTERSFISPVQKTTGATGQMTQATQPVQSPGTSSTTQPVEAPGVTTVMQPADQDISYQTAADRPEVQFPGPARQTVSGAIGSPKIQD